MKKQNDLTRSFGGIVSNNVKDFHSKEHMRSEQKHLRAYKQGRKYFYNGTKDEETGLLVPFKVEEKWS
jgi:hypothetical protein